MISICYQMQTTAHNRNSNSSLIWSFFYTDDDAVFTTLKWIVAKNSSENQEDSNLGQI